MPSPSGLQVELYRTPLEIPVDAFVLGDAARTVSGVIAAVRWRAPRARTRVFVGGLPWECEELPEAYQGDVVLVGMPADPASLSAVAAFFAALGKAVAATLTAGAIGTTAGAGATAAVVAGSAVGVFIGNAVIAYGISAIAGSLISPPEQSLGKNDGGEVSPTLQDGGNAVRPNAPYPYVAGTFRMVPPICYPHTYVRGGESVFLGVFIIGLGEHSFSASDILIGDVPLANFDRAVVAIRQGELSAPNLTLFSRRILQATLNSVFDPIQFDTVPPISPWVQHEVPGEGHERLGIDLNFTQGVSRISNSGRVQICVFGFQVEYRKNAGAWSDALAVPGFGPVDVVDGGPNQLYSGNPFITTFQGLSVLRFRGDSSRPFQIGFTWNVTGDADDIWDVRVRRVEMMKRGVLLGSDGTTAYFGQVVWFALKGFNYRTPPMQASGVATIELEVPLDEQFGGLQNNLSVLVRRKCRIYDPAASGGADADGWSNLRFVTSNCSALVRDMLQGENNRNPVPDSELNIQAFTDFYIFCRDFNDGGTGALRFDFIFDARTNIFDACRAVASAGRGRFIRDAQGRHTIIFDGPKSGAERHLINAANCRGFKISNVLPRPINAIRAQFVDATSGYDPDAELMVYADGYDEFNTEEIEIETRSYIGATNPSTVFARARYDLADQQLRPRLIEAEMGIEQLGIGTGSLVRFSHPGAFIGEAWGRIRRTSAVIYRDSLDEDFNAYSGISRTVLNALVQYGDFNGSFVHGRGAAVIVSTGTAAATLRPNLPAPQNWTGCRIDVHVQPEDPTSLSSTAGVSIGVFGPTLFDLKVWHFGTSDGVTTSAMTSIGEVLTSAADFSIGSFNPAMVIGWSVEVNTVAGAAGRRWRVDNLRVSRTDGAIVEVELDQPVSMQHDQTYRIEHRFVDTAGFQNEIKPRDVRTLSSYGILAPQVVSAVYLQTPVTAGTTEPLEGDLYSFGLSSSVSVRCIVKEKISGPELTARLVLVDEAPGMHTSTGTLPPFEPGTTLTAPIGRVGPAKPIIRQIITDERALVRVADGTLQPRILLDLQQGLAAGRPRADFWSVRYRRTAPTGFAPIALPRVDVTSSQVVITDVDEGADYEILVQAITRGGLVSDIASATVTVLGKTGAPPDVQDFRVEGLNLQWTLLDPPSDLAGFRIRRGTIGGSFAQAFSVHGDTLVDAPPFSTAQLDPGLTQLFIVAEDTAGNQSEVPAELVAFVGLVPQQNVVNTIDLDALGFPIVNQIDRVLDGFEDLIQKETPDTALDVIYAPEDVQEIVSPLQGDAQTRLSVESSIVFAGGSALRLTDLDASGAKVTISYTNTISRELSLLRCQFRGTKAAVTWTVRFKLIDALNANKWSRWDTTGIATNTWVAVSKDLATAPTATGASGAVDLERIKHLEIEVVCSTAAVNDASLIDELEWVGGALNGVEVISGDLVTQASAGSFWNDNPTAPFWSSTPSEQFWAVVSYLDGIYEFTATVGASDVPSDLRIEISDPGVPYQLFYKPLGGSNFVPFPGVLANVEVDTYSFQLHLSGGNVQAVVDQLAVILDVADEREVIKEHSVSNTGTVRIPITKTYREIRTVLGQPQGAGVAFPEVLDKDVTLGPSVTVKDAAGTRIARTVDWFIEGVKG